MALRNSKKKLYTAIPQWATSDKQRLAGIVAYRSAYSGAGTPSGGAVQLFGPAGTALMRPGLRWRTWRRHHWTLAPSSGAHQASPRRHTESARTNTQNNAFVITDFGQESYLNTFHNSKPDLYVPPEIECELFILEFKELNINN